MAAIIGILISRLQRHCVIYGVEPLGVVKIIHVLKKDSELPHFILTVYTVNIMKKGGTAKNSKSDFIPIHSHDFFFILKYCNLYFHKKRLLLSLLLALAINYL